MLGPRSSREKLQSAKLIMITKGASVAGAWQWCATKDKMGMNLSSRAKQTYVAHGITSTNDEQYLGTPNKV
eukprot:scaffold155673_cov59-Attheya_sp.AAC.2